MAQAHTSRRWFHARSGVRASLSQTLALSVLLAALTASPQRSFALSDQQSPGSQTQTQQQTYEHANGLRLVLATSYRATIIANGFLIEPTSGQDRRYPLTISVNLLANSPDVITDRQARLGSRRMRYAVTMINEGGSGGAEYELVAIEYTQGRWIQYVQRAQEEGMEPVFQAWEIAKGVSFTPR
jgi:hypothetical protein